MIMQVVNATIPVVAPSLFDQINATAATASTLISLVAGMIVYAITTFRKVTKGQLSERDKWIMDVAKGVQINAQKGAETIGREKAFFQKLYEINLNPEQRKQIEESLIPILKQADESLQAANSQAEMIKAKAVQIFGPEGDVDQDKTIPREGFDTSGLRKGMT